MPYYQDLRPGSSLSHRGLFPGASTLSEGHCSPSVGVCSDCHSDIAEAGWHQQGDLIFSQLWRLQGWVEGQQACFPWRQRPLGLQTGGFSLRPPVPLLCTCTSVCLRLSHKHSAFIGSVPHLDDLAWLSLPPWRLSPDIIALGTRALTQNSDWTQSVYKTHFQIHHSPYVIFCVLSTHTHTHTG